MVDNGIDGLIGRLVELNELWIGVEPLPTLPGPFPPVPIVIIGPGLLYDEVSDKSESGGEGAC